MINVTPNKIITSFINTAERELCKELNKQMEFVNKDEKDLVAKKECIKFLKSIKKTFLLYLH